jgi:hypothetical protein
LWTMGLPREPRCRSMRPAGRRRIETEVLRVQSLCVAHGKLFVLCGGGAVYAFSIATGQLLGKVEIVGSDGKAVAFQRSLCLLIVDEMMVVVERCSNSIEIWPLPQQFLS